MAKAYLGKISALVTANTSDFNSKLNASAKEVRSFASAMQSSLTQAEQAASTSLRGIYTESQKVSRALQAVASQRLSFKGFDTSTFASLGQAVEQFKKIQNAAVQVNEPLSAAARTIEKLSASVQTAFEPAMRSAQRSAENLSAVLERGGTAGERGFERIRLKAEQAAQAANRLAEASRLATGPRGSELAFTAPRVRDALTASAAARSRAQDAAASVLDDGSVGRSVQQLARLDDLIQRVQATIESRRILNIDTAAAEQRLTRLIRRSGELSESLDAAVAAPAAAEAIRQRDAEIAAAEGQFSRRATPIGGLLRQRQEEERRRRDAEIAAAEGQFSRRATPIGGLLRQRQEEERRRRDAEIAAAEGQFSRRATPIGGLLRQRQEEERRRRDAEIAEAQGRFSRRATPIDTAGDLERQARSRMGGDIPGGGGPLGGQLEVGRQVDNVINRVTAARQQLDTLPDPLRTALIPALQRATDQASTLARQGFGATAAQIRNAANEAERFEQRVARSQRALNFGQQFGGAGRRGLEFGLQAQSLQGYTAQLQVLQRTLSGVSTQARGPALDAFNRLRTAIATAADNGTVDLEQTRRQINGLAQDAVRAAAAAANISPGRLNRQFQRAGDIGRGAFGNIGLGVQQAVFAIEDFFSVTGGLDQRIRAAGNNISQLGFVLGGTQGLIAGVAAAITGQLIAAYIKWANAGVGTEDTLRSLNDSLARQKSLLEEISGAFASIGDEISRVSLAGPAAEFEKLSRSLDEIRNKQREARTESRAEVDPESQRIRGTIAARQRELEQSTDGGRRVILQRQINSLQEQERQRLSELSRPQRSVDQDAIVRAVADSYVNVAEGRIASLLEQTDGQADPLEAVRVREEARRRADAAAEVTRRRFAEAPGNVERSQAAIDILEAGRSQLQRIAENGRGFFGTASNEARAAQQELLSIEQLLREARAPLEAALDELVIAVSESALEIARRVGSSQAALQNAVGSDQASTLRVSQELEIFARQLRDAQQRATDARSRGDAAGTREAQDEVNAINEATSAYVATARSVTQFAQALDRVASQLSNTVAQEAQQAADQARRQANEAEAARFGPVAGNVALEEADFRARRRERLERDARRAEERRRELENERNGAVRRFERDGAADPGVAASIRQRDEAQAELDRAQREGRQATGDAVRRRDEAQRDLDRRFENSRDGRRLRDRADNDDLLSQVRRQEEDSILRGREQLRSPAERAGIELARNLSDIQNAFGELPKAQQDAAALAAAQRRAVEDAQRQAAPAIFNLADEVQNAVLQGPSRAALQATDVSTVQGASELNRLLRGDDSARNQNLVELQRQNNESLKELVNIAKANGAPPGIFD
jgi:hypothetical protein